ncbi:two component transcriptional regulator, LytTR family [Chitinophaga rupis]|uniref:Two component transcriptional regulator, LytTR family n=1 Tax=Chitinophaga rupis TaxID=573321 RepID=A0A1H8IWY9_9BACT|nr:LytTR family DNA-binding domain-containing protein [Chitinophaga rupis]SEN72992.1 two component transcriptional regulator, LytTR family [Chitinophaga rupis]
MLSCIIIDDEQHAIDLLKSYIEKVSFLELRGTYNNPLNAITATDVDIIFIDMHMPQLSGMDFIKLMKGKARIIITSAFKEYALESFEYEVLDYLLKPISFDRFLKAVQKAMNQLTFAEEDNQTKQTKNYIVVKTDAKNKLQKIELDEIVYIEGMKNYVTIHKEQQQVMTLLNMKDLDNDLPKDQFIRVHKSYIISIDKIKIIEGNQIFLKNVKESIPLSETYRQAFFDLLKQTIIGNKKPI